MIIEIALGAALSVSCFTFGKDVSMLQRTRWEEVNVQHKKRPDKLPSEVISEITTLSKICGVPDDTDVQELLHQKTPK